jgi:F5/8 type C domain
MTAEAASKSAPPNAGQWFRNWFLLEDARRRAEALGPERQARVRKYYEAGLRRALVADELGDEQSLAAAFVLYRGAADLLAAAVVATFEPGDALASPWEALGELGRGGRVALPEGLDETRRILTPASPLVYDETPPDVLRAHHATVKRTLRALRDLLEPRTPGELRITRAVRLGLASVVGLIVVVWLGSSLFAPSNLALHKKVTMSQSHPASTAPSDGSGLVNGEVEAGYGVQTTRGAAWVMIDLDASYALGDVVVHNRKDGWFDEGLPLTLELSQDGKTFKEVARRTEPFTATNPWVVEAHGAEARFVRLRSPSYIALTEIEVHKGS